jgi:hypothetical protein
MPMAVRFLVTDSAPLSERDLITVLAALDPSFRLDEEGMLTLDGSDVARLAIEYPGDPIFDADIDELRESVRGSEDDEEDARIVERVLEGTRAIVAARFDDSTALDRKLASLDPLWDWLLKHRSGLLQVDGEGFYDGDEFTFEC